MASILQQVSIIAQIFNNYPPQPSTLGVIGAGPIGLEFASLYAKLGTKVTVFNIESGILKRRNQSYKN